MSLPDPQHAPCSRVPTRWRFGSIPLLGSQARVLRALALRIWALRYSYALAFTPKSSPVEGLFFHGTETNRPVSILLFSNHCNALGQIILKHYSEEFLALLKCGENC